MIARVEFVLGAASSLAALPSVVRADEPEPPPSAAPSPSPQPTPSRKPHVHGANGLIRIPENRPVEWKMEVLDGPEFRLSAYRGMAVFVNVFATWCGPCREEQPVMVAFARAHPDDTAVIGIDVYEADNDVRAYRKKFEIPYPIAIHRSRMTVPAIFKNDSLIYPTTLAFRPDGTLSCAWSGGRTRAGFEDEREYALRSLSRP
ncbi:MAG: TlpA family protein disulfide reductase [Candidatus Eremiobacteraeota bacterium]|nr:TlpA family protein disulfide reductase [Candidatus Eremiobacteraeota bacterium]